MLSTRSEASKYLFLANLIQSSPFAPVSRIQPRCYPSASQAATRFFQTVHPAPSRMARKAGKRRLVLLWRKPSSSYWAVRGHGMPLTVVAQRLNIALPTVSLAVQRGEKEVKGEGLDIQFHRRRSFLSAMKPLSPSQARNPVLIRESKPPLHGGISWCDTT